MAKKENYTVFYTPKFEKLICQVDGIIPLNKGDLFPDGKGNVYIKLIEYNDNTFKTNKFIITK